MKTPQRTHRLALTLIAGATLALTGLTASASSHREGPFITNQPKVDGTDLYLFRSYEPTRQDYVTVIADYIPFQDPQGGPNFFQFDQNALYEIHFDTNGDAKEDLTFQFRFKNTFKSANTINVGGKALTTSLINNGPITGVNSANLNVRETYTIDMVKGERRGSPGTRLANPAGGNDFDKPVDNIGDKSFGGTSGYETYANKHIYNVSLGSCGTARVFVGQRKEPFFIAVGKIFDLINLNPLGAETGGNANDLERKNIRSISMELPIACVATAADPVIGAWTTASVRQGRLINGAPGSGLNNATKEGGAWTQVSRLGMPLVNEVVIGMTDKDKFNSSKPRNDAQFADYVTNPTLPALIQALYPSAPAPTNFPRTDLVAAFLTGLPTVNRPKSFGTSEFMASDMLRLNTSIAATPLSAQNSLGVAAGDNAGFPNGRRPGDDVVDVSLRVAMGALCALTGTGDALKVGCKPSDAPAGTAPITDGVRKTAADFKPGFPYLNTPLPGNQ